MNQTHPNKDPEMNVFQTVRDIIQTELENDFPLPPFSNEVLSLLSQAHIYYRTYKYEKISQKASKDPSQGHPAVYGAALQLLGDYTSIGSYAINIALVAKCTENLLGEYRQLSESYQKLCQTTDWQYPIYHPIKWKQETKTPQNLLSPSLFLTWQIQAMGWMNQILRVKNCSLDVFRQTFKLSMSLCDAYLVLNDDPQMRYAACTELAANWNGYLNQLKENQKYLLEEIKKRSDLTDRILSELDAEEDSSSIIDQLNAEFKDFLAEQAEKMLEDIQDVAEETLDTFYVKGKITPLHIDLTEGKNATPALPHGRFPPWTGQTVLLHPPKLPESHSGLIDDIFGNIGSNLSSIPKSSVKEGFAHLAGCVHHLYQNRTALSPFSLFA